MLFSRSDLDLPPASDWVKRWLSRLKPGSRVLDFAAGSGRNTNYAIEQGMQVLAVDSDASAVESISELAQRQVVDLEQGAWPLTGQQFDAVIVCNYLFRPRLDLLLGHLADGGLLIYETFMIGNEQYGRPRSANFLLRPNELFEVAQRAGLMPIAFEQGFFEHPKPAMRQRICAQRAPIDRQIFKPIDD